MMIALKQPCSQSNKEEEILFNFWAFPVFLLWKSPILFFQIASNWEKERQTYFGTLLWIAFSLSSPFSSQFGFLSFFLPWNIRDKPFSLSQELSSRDQSKTKGCRNGHAHMLWLSCPNSLFHIFLKTQPSSKRSGQCAYHLFPLFSEHWGTVTSQGHLEFFFSSAVIPTQVSPVTITSYKFCLFPICFIALLPSDNPIKNTNYRIS